MNYSKESAEEPRAAGKTNFKEPAPLLQRLCNTAFNCFI